MNHMITMNCWSIGRAEEECIGSFQLPLSVARERHGKTFTNPEGFAYRWEAAYPGLLNG